MKGNNQLKSFLFPYIFVNCSDPNLNIKVSNFDLENEKADSLPLVQQYDFNAKIAENGGYYVIPINLLSGIRENPFVSNNRLTKVNFGFRKSISVNVNIDLPANFVAEELPKKIRMTTPEKDISASRIIEYNPSTNRIMSVITLHISKSVYDGEEYPDLKEFYSRMIELVNESVVVKKK